MLSWDSEDEMWSRFVFELVIWLKEVTLERWTQPSGPLCLWQCFRNTAIFYRISGVESYNCPEIGVKYVSPKWDNENSPDRPEARYIANVSDWKKCLAACQVSWRCPWWPYVLIPLWWSDKYRQLQASRDCLYWQYGNEHATNALQCINAVSYESKTSYEAKNQMSGTKICYKGEQG